MAQPDFAVLRSAHLQFISSCSSPSSLPTSSLCTPSLTPLLTLMTISSNDSKSKMPTCRLLSPSTSSIYFVRSIRPRRNSPRSNALFSDTIHSISLNPTPPRSSSSFSPPFLSPSVVTPELELPRWYHPLLTPAPSPTTCSHSICLIILVRSVPMMPVSPKGSSLAAASRCHAVGVCHEKFSFRGL